MADWERGINQSCSPFQDHGILLHRSENSPYLAIPESEPEADSLQIYFLLNRKFVSSIVLLF